MSGVKQRKRSRWLWVFLLLLGLGVVYQQLSDAQKRFVQNMLRQTLYLPARYAV